MREELFSIILSDKRLLLHSSIITSRNINPPKMIPKVGNTKKLEKNILNCV